jgi:hypothetical protein
METGIARRQIHLEEYREQLAFRQGGRAGALLHYEQSQRLRQEAHRFC